VVESEILEAAFVIMMGFMALESGLLVPTQRRRWLLFCSRQMPWVMKQVGHLAMRTMVRFSSQTLLHLETILSTHSFDVYQTVLLLFSE